MQVTPPYALLKRVPPGVWAAVAWCASTASSLRGHLGLPFMPHGLPPLSAGDWALVTVGIVAALAGSRLLGAQPLSAVGLLTGASFAVALAVESTELATLHYVAVDVAMGAVVASRPRRTGLAAFAMAVGAFPAYAVTRSLLGVPLESVDSLRGSWDGGPFFTALAVVAFLIGNSVRQTRVYAQRLSARAALQAVTAERLRIARELHDMVAHSIGIVALQAGAARRVIDTQPAQARVALGEVETASRQTLSGLRRMVGALRQPEPGQEPDAAPLAPGLGLADIDRLAEQTTAAGVRVELRRRGEPRPLPPEIDTSAYRIVQEAVANVVRHAGTHACQVSIDWQDENLSIEVLDGGRGRGPTAGTAGTAGTGYGLVGMRERVTLLNGEFSAGARPEGGFRVAARLPLPTTVR